MPKVLVSDSIDQSGIDILSQVAQVDVKTGLPAEELVKVIPEYDGLICLLYTSDAARRVP